MPKKNTIPKNWRYVGDLPDEALVDVRVVAMLMNRAVGSVWRDVKASRIPAPLKVGPACTRWRIGAIRRHIADLEARP